VQSSTGDANSEGYKLFKITLIRDNIKFYLNAIKAKENEMMLVFNVLYCLRSLTRRDRQPAWIVADMAACTQAAF
jgi:hypothetical protein